jgi:peptidoglycan hydrolase-like protein with peptidoglycan-binding domain
VLVLAPGQADEEALGLRSAQRAEVQVALGSLGLYNGAADGAFGPHTRSAISLYQQQQSAAVTGYLTAGQWAALHQIALQVAANAGNSGQTGDGTTSTTSNDALRNAWLGK